MMAVRSMTNLRNTYLPNISRIIHRHLRPQARYCSASVENTLDNGPIKYSTSKAAQHKVNTTIGLETERKVTLKPLVGGTLTFATLMYFMFLYDGDKNDVFQTITPESVEEEYEKSLKKSNELLLNEGHVAKEN